MDALLLSRIQFGATAAFHILWPVMSIGLALFVFVMEALWVYTGKEHFYRQARFWLKIFVLSFAVGVASGFVMAFQFGTNWSQFAATAGSFFGNLIGFETTIAFTLESAALGVLVFGWNRVPRWLHLTANGLVFVGAAISAFWIMVANSWMQVPIGTELQNGIIVVTNHLTAILNPESLISYAHMMMASMETTVFMIGGISAWQLLRKNRTPERVAFFRQAFIYSLGIAFILAPLQIVLGDMSGQTVAAYQPEKLAALELNWQTNPLGTGSPWSVVAWPNAAGTGNAFALNVPNGLSLLTTHSMTGTVPGLAAFPKNDRPTAGESTVTYYAFRVMMAIGFFFALIALIGAWLWWRGKLSLAEVTNHRWFLRVWVFAIPLGFVATEAGWMVREIGRQPWIIFHMMRLPEGLSTQLQPLIILTVIGAIVLIYVTLLVLFIYFSWRTVDQGPDLTSPLPSPVPTPAMTDAA